MSTFKCDTITNAAGTGKPDFPNSLTVAGAPLTSATPGTGLQITNEATLDAAISAGKKELVIAGSFPITSKKVLADNMTVRGTTNSIQISAASGSFGAGDAMFEIPAGVKNVNLLNLNLFTSLTNISCISIKNTAVRNNVRGCLLEIPAASTYFCVYNDGQKNRVSNNSLVSNGRSSVALKEDGNASGNANFGNVAE